MAYPTMHHCGVPPPLAVTVNAVEEEARRAIPAPHAARAINTHARPLASYQNPPRAAQRQRQIDLGKASSGYQRYAAMVPKHARRPHRATTHPVVRDGQGRGVKRK